MAADVELKQQRRPPHPPTDSDLKAQRNELADRLADLLDGPLTLLAFVSLALVIAEYAGWLSPTWLVISDRILLGIWAVFALEFFTRLALACDKGRYLRQNWIAAVSVALPLFRVVRVLRVARLLRSLRLVRLLTSLNRGLREIGASMAGRTFTYFLTATVVVILAGAAGILALESDSPRPVVNNFGDALWWTTTLVAANELGEKPSTPEGRVLAIALALFGMAVFGYITAALASYFVGASGREQAAAAEARATDLAGEVSALRQELADLHRLLDTKLAAPPPDSHGTP